MKNSIKSKNYPKRKTLRELEKLTLIDRYIVIKPSVPWGRQKSTSEEDACRLNSIIASTTNTQIESIVNSMGFGRVSSCYHLMRIISTCRQHKEK